VFISSLDTQEQPVNHPSLLLRSLITALCIFLPGCASLEGIISATSYNGMPEPVLFYVSSNLSSTADDRITALIEAKMIQKGFQKASVIEAANVGLTYKYSIAQYGEPDYSVWRFEVAVLGLRQRVPGETELFWEGKIYSAGRTRDIGLIAPHFIDVLFENYDTTVLKKNFSRHLRFRFL
jgi:hypothetical protein